LMPTNEEVLQEIKSYMWGHYLRVLTDKSKKEVRG